MNKSIEFTELQIKEYENNATMFIFPIDSKTRFGKNSFFEEIAEANDTIYTIRKFIKMFSPLKAGDKDVWIKEEYIENQTSCNCGSFCDCEPWIIYKTDNLEDGMIQIKLDGLNLANLKWKVSSKMKKEQSRYTIKEVIDVRVGRVQDIRTAREMEKILGTNLINKNGNISIEDFGTLIDMFKKEIIDKDYVFIIEVKR